MIKAIKHEIEYRNMKKELKRNKKSLDFNFRALSDAMVQSPEILLAPKK